MSENLKRAESLFNRIMNPNRPQSSGDSASNTKPYHKSSNHNQQNGNYGNDQELGRSNSRHSNHHSNGYTNGNSSNGNGHHRYNTRSYNKYNHNQPSPASSTAIASFDLPKRDPAKEAQDAVSALGVNLHVLPYCWTIWFHSRTKAKAPVVSEEATQNAATADLTKPGAAAVDSYLQAATEIEFPNFENPTETVKPIASLEQMWVSLSSLKKTHELVNGSELLIFKTGVNPVWEDPINAKGGRWVFRFSHRVHPNAAGQETQENVQKGRRRATLVWERLVLKTLTGSILLGRKEHHDALLSDIVGLVLSVRRDEEIISIWNSNLHFGKKKAEEDEKKGGLTGFHARRVYCDAILRVIREVDAIMLGSDCIETQLSSSTERVSGVTFEYRLHSDNAHPFNPERARRGKNYHHHNQKDEKEEEA